MLELRDHGPTRTKPASQEHVMSINHQQELELRRIEAGLRQSDPRLASIMTEFGDRYPGQSRPVERTNETPSRARRLRLTIGWIIAVLAVLVIVIVLGRAMVG
jgi:hypothetical protein